MVFGLGNIISTLAPTAIGFALGGPVGAAIGAGTTLGKFGAGFIDDPLARQLTQTGIGVAGAAGGTVAGGQGVGSQSVVPSVAPPDPFPTLVDPTFTSETIPTVTDPTFTGIPTAGAMGVADTAFSPQDISGVNTPGTFTDSITEMLKNRPIQAMGTADTAFASEKKFNLFQDIPILSDVIRPGSESFLQPGKAIGKEIGEFAKDTFNLESAGIDFNPIFKFFNDRDPNNDEELEEFKTNFLSGLGTLVRGITPGGSRRSGRDVFQSVRNA
jgi:hypothetical protein